MCKVASLLLLGRWQCANCDGSGIAIQRNAIPGIELKMRGKAAGQVGPAPASRSRRVGALTSPAPPDCTRTGRIDEQQRQQRRFVSGGGRAIMPSGLRALGVVPTVLLR